MYQWAFLIFLYFLGSLYTKILFPHLCSKDRQFLSPFLGVGFSGIVVGLLLIVRIPLSLPLFFICLLFILCIAKIIMKKPSSYTHSWSQSCKDMLSNIFSIPFVLYMAVSCFFSLTVFAGAYPDSTQFEGAGRYLVQGGLVHPNTPQMVFMLNGRLLIVAAMHAINRLFHGYSLYALNPTMCIWLLFFLGYTMFLINKKIDKITRIFLVYFFVITLGFYKHFFNEMLYIHSNQLAMIFFTISIVSLYLYAVTEEKSWVYIGSLTVGFACLTRIDMFLCSLIFFFLLTIIRSADYKIIKYSWYIFILSVFPWRIFTLYYTPWGVWYVGAEKLYLLIGANTILCLLSILMHKYNRIHFTLLRNLPFILGPIIILLLILYAPEKIQLSWNLFFKYILLGHSSWLFFISALIISTGSFFLMSRYNKNYYILFAPIVLYLFLLFLLVAFSGYENVDHSARRMLLHIVPLFVYFLFIGLSETITNKPKSSRRIFEF